MTVKERALASRLIEKIDANPPYARQVGLRYELVQTLTSRSPDSISDSEAEKEQ